MNLSRTLVFNLALLCGGLTPALAQEDSNWQTLNKEVETRYHAGDYEGAMKSAEQALQVAEQNAKADPSALATSLNSLALVYQAQGDTAQAEKHFKRALAIQEKALGPDHLDLASTLTNLAWISYKQGQYKQAEPLFQRALAIREKALGPDDREVANSLTSIAVLYMSTHREEEAKLLSARAARIWGLDKMSDLDKVKKEEL